MSYFLPFRLHWSELPQLTAVIRPRSENYQIPESGHIEGLEMDIDHNHFSDEASALKEIEAAGYKPITLEFPAESNDDHWHDFDSMLYIIDGDLTITETETGETCVCGVGSRIVASHGVLHREKTDGYKALIGLSVEPEELTQPINKAPPVAPNYLQTDRLHGT